MTHIATLADSRRRKLRAATADLSIDDRNALNQYLIGALSESVDAESWGEAVAVAFACLRQERDRKAERRAS